MSVRFSKKQLQLLVRDHEHIDSAFVANGEQRSLVNIIITFNGKCYNYSWYTCVYINGHGKRRSEKHIISFVGAITIHFAL